MKELMNKLGEMEYDGLFTGLTPPARVAGGTIAKLTTAATLKRGTVLAKSSTSGKLYVLGSTAASGDTLTPDCVLCDDIDVGTDEDVTTTVYESGCFNPDKVTVAEGYEVTQADKDKLRERDIVFVAASPAI